jgi:catalase
LRVRPELFADHFSQALQFFNSQTEIEQNHIISAFIFELSKVETKAVRERMVGQLANVNLSIAKRVATGLGMVGDVRGVTPKVAARTDLPESPALSILKKAAVTLEGRMIGCLVADGTDAKTVQSLASAVSKAGGELKIVAPKIGGAVASDSSVIEADFQLAGGPSVLFDAVFLALSDDGASLLAQEAAAISFVHDAFAHLKVIGATSGAGVLLDKAGVVADEGVLSLSNKSTVKTFTDAAARGRIWTREPSLRAVY